MSKILVCDDDPGVLEVIKIILEENNYEVITASNGKGIQKMIAQTKPDMLFLDIWMPGIDGKEITKLLKRDAQFKDMPIIIISALNDTKDIAQEVGADGFLSKPFTITDLLEVVENNLKKK
jgi:CheY-like chemotaxis protein